MLTEEEIKQVKWSGKPQQTQPQSVNPQEFGQIKWKSGAESKPAIAGKYTQQDLAEKPLFQAAKGLYEGFQSIPGGKTYGKILGKVFPEDEGMDYSRQEVRAMTPEPKGFLPTATRMTGRILPEAVAMAPMIEGAMGLKALKYASPLAKASLGYGTYEGTKPLVDTEKPIQQKALDVPYEFMKGSSIAQGLGVAGEKVFGGLSGIAKKAFGKMSELDINKHIDNAISKAIKPSVSVKSTPRLFDQYKEKARSAVKSIVENKNILKLKDAYGEMKTKLPETLDEFSQSIDQVKQHLFTQYNKLATSAGKQGIKVNLKPIADSIEKEINNKTVRTMYPEVVANARRLAQRFRKAKSFTPEEAQQAIEMLNNSLKAFYRNPNPQGTTNAVVDASIATKMRKALDTAIQTLDDSYSALKREYGSLRGIQDEVTKRAVVDSGKNIKGFFDLSDVFSTGDIVKGLIRMNPADIAKGTAQKGIMAYFKNLNNPNRIIKDMFNTVEKSYKPPATVLYRSMKEIPKLRKTIPKKRSSGITARDVRDWT